MRARHWMIGCLIGLAGVGSAMAADMGDRDITATSRATADNSVRDAGNNAAGDALGVSRDCPPPRRGGDADNADADSRGTGGGEHGGRISAPTTAKPAMLGWQSLLPGSIQ